MSRDGSGAYTLPSNSFNPAVAATTIDQDDWNTTAADLETALTESIARDGQTTTTAVIPFASGVKTDTVVEKTANAGVTIDGVLLKDGGMQLGAAGTVVFEGATADAYETTLSATDPTADRAITLPDASDMLVGRDTTDTLTNKTLSTPTLTSAVLNTAVSGTAVLDEDTMSSDSATQLATQQSIKAYVDAQTYTAPAGSVLQTLQTVVTAATASIASSTFAAIAGLSQAITPASASNKVLVRCVIITSGDSSNGPSFILYRDSTAIGVGAAAGSRIQATGGGGYNASALAIQESTLEFLDSPATTSEVTYTVQWARLNGAGTMVLNRSRTDTDSGAYSRGISTITVQEIKG